MHSSVVLLTLLVEKDGPVRRLALVLGSMFQNVENRGQMVARAQICVPWSHVLRRMSSVAGARTVAVLACDLCHGQELRRAVNRAQEAGAGVGTEGGSKQSHPDALVEWP